MRWWTRLSKTVAGLRRARLPGAGWFDRVARRLPSWDAGAEEPWDADRTWRHLKYLSLATAIAAVVVGWQPAEQWLRGYAAQRRAARVRPEMVRLAGAEPWMGAGFRWSLQKAVAQPLSDDPMDAHGLRLAMQSLLATGWVERVDRIERTPGAVIVQARYRRPALAVEQPEGWRLCDAAAVCLPGVYTDAQVRQLRVARVVGAPRVAACAGQPWPDQGVSAALALVGTLADQSWAWQVRAVDISGRDARGRLQLALLTERGKVVWGLPVGQEQPIEPSAATKKAWLTEVVRQQGAIDAHGRIVEVNGPAVFVREAPALARQDPRRPPQYTWGR